VSVADVSTVRALWDAFERGEVPLDAFDETARWHTASDLPDTEVVTGPLEIAKMLAAGWENVVDGGCKADEITQLGERILVRWHGWGIGRASGLPVDWQETHAYRVREGKIAIVREYRTWEEALAAGEAG
jgi:hypothetical protein